MPGESESRSNTLAACVWWECHMFRYITTIITMYKNNDKFN